MCAAEQTHRPTPTRNPTDTVASWTLRGSTRKERPLRRATVGFPRQRAAHPPATSVDGHGERRRSATARATPTRCGAAGCRGRAPTGERARRPPPPRLVLASWPSAAGAPRPPPPRAPWTLDGGGGARRQRETPLARPQPGDTKYQDTERKEEITTHGHVTVKGRATLARRATPTHATPPRPPRPRPQATRAPPGTSPHVGPPHPPPVD